MNKRIDKEKGFTLIEMLVVIAIVGLLSSVVVVGLGGARQKARDARRAADIRQLQNWAEVSYTSTSGYPEGKVSGIGLPDDAPIKTDPQNIAYLYKSLSTDKETYELGTCLEDSDNVPSDGKADCAITCTANLYCVTPD